MIEVQATTDAAAVRAFAARLSAPARSITDAERIDLIRALEELTCVSAGAQAITTADFDASERAEQAAHGVPAARQGRGVAAQIALARRESPHRGLQHLQLATILPRELPHTQAAFVAGRISERRATSW